MELMNLAIRMDRAAFLAHHRIEAQRFEHPPVMTVEESEHSVPHLPERRLAIPCVSSKCRAAVRRVREQGADDECAG